MNYIIRAQIQNMVNISKAFEASCKAAATMDDGKTSKEEAKTIQKISAATNKFIVELQKIDNQNKYI